MITTIRKHQHLARVIFLLAVTCMTTLFLLFGSLVSHSSRFSPFSFAHAATTCASTKGTQQAVCEQQSPIIQGCSQDGHVLELQSVYTPQNLLIGQTSLLYSATCKTYWIRTIGYANRQRIKAVDAVISFHTGKVEDNKTVAPSDGKQIIALTDMLFIQPDVSPTNWAGKFFLKGQTQPITIPL